MESSRSSHLVTPSKTFSNLPRELRDQIYYELWRGTPGVLVTSDERGTITAYPGAIGPSEQETTKLPSWLLASKTVLQEGIEELQRKGSMAIVLEGAHYNLGFVLPSISLFTTQNLDITLQIIPRELQGEPGQDQSCLIRPLIEDIALLEATLSQHTVTMKTKTLKLQMYIDHRNSNIPYAVDLSRLDVFLARILPLDTLELVVYESLPNDAPIARASLEASLVSEGKRLGSQLSMRFEHKIVKLRRFYWGSGNYFKRREQQLIFKRG